MELGRPERHLCVSVCVCTCLLITADVLTVCFTCRIIMLFFLIFTVCKYFVLQSVNKSSFYQILLMQVKRALDPTAKNCLETDSLEANKTLAVSILL